MSRPKLPLEKIQQINELLDQGFTQLRVGTILGLSHCTVNKYLDKDRFLERRRRQYSGPSGRVHTTVNGVHGKFKVRKRPRPERCELCNSSPVSHWYWHHWDDDHLNWGLWLCWTCHMFAEALEKGLDASHIQRYFNLKAGLSS